METLSQLPKEFVERLRRMVPLSHQVGVFSTFARERPTTLRANQLKTTAVELKELLKERGFVLSIFRSIPEALVLTGGRSSRELTSTELYRRGFFYLQSLSSMLPPLVLEPKPGELVLDLAAAPGSKTTQMAALMGNSGRIVAVDSNQRRLYKLLANLKTQGAVNVETVRKDGRFYWREHTGEFDKVLLDAPCTTEARFNVFEPSTFCHWSVKEVKRMSFLQRSLIFSAVNCLKPGGVLVYSTCTFSPEENEAVVSFALAKFKGRLVIEEAVDLRGWPNTIPGLSKFEGSVFDPSVKMAVRILPTREMTGFFVARLRKDPGAFC